MEAKVMEANMKRNYSILSIAVLVILCGPHLAKPDVIVDWNALAAQNLSGGNPLPHVREFAILHVAIYDAVLSVPVDYQPSRFVVRASPHASAEAAAVTAAHDVLVSFHPANVANFDAQYVKH